MDGQTDTKSAEVVNEKTRQILEKLYKSEANDDTEHLASILSEFRILTREKTIDADILDGRCVNLLVKLSRNYQTEAQKSISNLLLNYVDIRNDFVTPYIECVESRLKELSLAIDQLTGSGDAVGVLLIPNRTKSQICGSVYYDLRILFLLSALCLGSRAAIRERLIEPILKVTTFEAKELGPKNYHLVVESLKTLFNLTMAKSYNTDTTAQLIKILFTYVGTEKDLECDPESGDKLDPNDQLLVNLIHLLTNMPEKVYHELTDDDSDKILEHLDIQLRTYNKNNFRDKVLPVLNVCANICKYKDDVRRRWFKEVIGSTEDFEKRPEECDTPRGRLVKLMTSVDFHIKEIASEFLYALCGADAEKLITYTGFGNSAGYLSNKGLLSKSKDQSDPDSNGGTTDSDSDQKYNEIRHKIDPITGKLETAKSNPMAGMSEEEKEWHAHQLANAIDKLSKIGVMKPMAINSKGEMSGLSPGAPPTDP